MKSEEIRIYALLYGPHEDLHRRLLDSIARNVPEDVGLDLWLNVVGDATKYMVSELGGGPRSVHVNTSDTNVPKYEAMREMFGRLKAGAHPEVKWLVWFDDDAHIEGEYGHWWIHTTGWIKEREPKNVCYTGQCWFIDWKAGQEQFIREAPWYKGLPAKMVGNKRKRPGIEFAQGSYWWLRRDVMQQLDWPDPRLKHNGGDTMLGEAVRQQGLPFHKLPWDCFGVKTNDAPRRGHHEAPAGCIDKNARA